MNCTVIYGHGRNIQRKRVMPVEMLDTGYILVWREGC